MLEVKLRNLDITAADREVALALVAGGNVEAIAAELHITNTQVRQSLSNLYVALKLNPQNISTLTTKLNQLEAE